MAKERNTTKKLLSSEEAAEYIGLVRPRTLAAWRQSGRGPRFVKLDGGMVGYLREDLDDYLSARTTDPADSSGLQDFLNEI